MWSLGTWVEIVVVVEDVDFPGLFVNSTLRLWLSDKGVTLRLLVNENDWGAYLEIAVSSAFWLPFVTGRSSPEETEEGLLNNGTLAAGFFLANILCCARD